MFKTTLIDFRQSWDLHEGQLTSCKTRAVNFNASPYHRRLQMVGVGVGVDADVDVVVDIAKWSVVAFCTFKKTWKLQKGAFDWIIVIAEKSC